MKWNYYNVEKPVIGQEVVFIRQYMEGNRAVCEACEGKMLEDGIHTLVGGLIYSKGYVPELDVTVWADRGEFMS